MDVIVSLQPLYTEDPDVRSNNPDEASRSEEALEASLNSKTRFPDFTNVHCNVPLERHRVPTKELPEKLSEYEVAIGTQGIDDTEHLLDTPSHTTDFFTFS